MALVAPAPEQARRHALVIGTAKSPEGWDDIGKGVRAEVAAARELLLQLLGYRQDSYREMMDPTSSDLIKGIARWRMDIGPTTDDWLVVYYSGHGIEHAGSLRLVTADIEADLLETAPSAQDVVNALVGGEKVPAHALVIFDACRSGAAHLDTEATAARLREAAGGAARGADLHVIATSRSIGEATVTHFIDALRLVLRDGVTASKDDEYAELAPTIGKVNEVMPRGSQQASYSGSGERGLCFFPNLGWLPRLRVDLAEITRQRVLHRIQANALRGHWSPRARGVASEVDPGWFFTGRVKALRHIVTWLTSAAPVRGLVVYGRPGSGKSAVLARIVTLADSHQQAIAAQAGALAHIDNTTVAPLGSIHVAVHARAKDASQIALEIAGTLGLDLAPFGPDAELAVVGALEQRGAQSVVVVDALDEAERPEDAATFVQSLSRRAPNLRLIVGLRAESTNLLSMLGADFEKVDLDADAWHDPEGMVRYIATYMVSAPASSYAADHPAADEVARAVARSAGSSFLVASLTARALSAAPVLRPEELDALPDSVGTALALDLDRFKGAARAQLHGALTALACGEGRGLPPAEWLTIAGALSQGTVTEAALRRWAEDAAFYIVGDEEAGVPVRRLYHEALADHLRKQVSKKQHVVIVDALRQSVSPGPGKVDWRKASSYILAHYPRHLRKAQAVRTLFDLFLTQDWTEAKRERFGDIALVLADLDMLLELAESQRPLPDVEAIVFICRTYAKLGATAPPIVIDVLAALGQWARAELMAEGIQFPLDRCQAFALLAQRCSQSDPSRAARYVDQTRRAAQAVKGHFSTMALYWLVSAAVAVQDAEAVRYARNAIYRVLDVMPGATKGVHVARRLADVSGSGLAQISFELWARDQTFDGFKGTEEFALPHWLFWAAMSLRELGEKQGLAQIAAVLRKRRSLWTNLALQTAAIAAPRMLHKVEVKTDSIAKPGNIALALIEAGHVRRFDEVRATGAFVNAGPADAQKRYAWALARCGDYWAALDVASRIDSDPEEQARAFYRIAITATGKNAAAVENAATRACELRAHWHEWFTTAEPPLPDAWRVDSWLAAAMLAAGRTKEAEELAESVVAAGVVPSRHDSLAMATPVTAVMKGHVQVSTSSETGEDLPQHVSDFATQAGTKAALAFLEIRNPTARNRASSLLGLSRSEPESDEAYALWLKSLVAARKAGLDTIEAVLADRERVEARLRILQSVKPILQKR